MKTISTILLITIVMAVNSFAAFPEVEGMKKEERITVSLMYSEPAITEYLLVFESGSVTIRENDKLLGKLTITEEDAAKIDHFLYTVRRGKRASRNLMGAASYRITHEQSGRKSGEWSYRIDTLKKTSKPVLSMRELVARVEKD